MRFQPGHKLSPGRPKGVRNKRTIEAMEILADNNFCPITAMIEGYKIAMERFIEDSEKVASGRISPMESDAVKYLKIAADHASDLAHYVYPKLKAIEQVKSNPLEDMTLEQKLLAMKQAVKMLENELKEDGSGST